jgi:hypothetical protein
MRLTSCRTAVVLVLTMSSAVFPITHFVSQAFATAGGGGGGEGKGGGDGGGKGGAADNNAGGQGKGKGSTASALGALNASHASARAMSHASPNSRVGKIAAYKAAINNLDAVNAAFALGNATVAQQTAAQTSAAQALAKAANKGITAGSVTSLDARLGVSLSAPTTADALATQAAALQTKH